MRNIAISKVQIKESIPAFSRLSISNKSKYQKLINSPREIAICVSQIIHFKRAIEMYDRTFRRKRRISVQFFADETEQWCGGEGGHRSGLFSADVVADDDGRDDVADDVADDVDVDRSYEIAGYIVGHRYLDESATSSIGTATAATTTRIVVKASDENDDGFGDCRSILVRS